MSIQEIRVVPAAEFDHHARDVERWLADEHNVHIMGMRSAEVIRLEGEGLTEEDAEAFSDHYLKRPITRSPHTVDIETDEVGIEDRDLPGVVDRDSEVIIQEARRLGVPVTAATSARVYFLPDHVGPEVERKVYDFLARPTGEVSSQRPGTLTINSEVPAVQSVPLSDMSTGEMMEFSEKGQLFLNELEMTAIKGYFAGEGRDPTDAELETIAAAWSEHCVHKTFKADVIRMEDGVEVKKDALFTRIKEASQLHFERQEVVSAYGDNSGSIRFGESHVITIKGETHNSPSAKSPFEGAATGVGGVIRDTLASGLGGRPFMTVFVHGVAPPDTDPRLLPEGVIAPKEMQKGVVAGVRDYGNPVGVPTANAIVVEDVRFGPKPTVMVVSHGVQPLEFAKKGAPIEGDLVVTMGGKTGRDGLHGATVSSGASSEATGFDFVQDGDPFTEKKAINLVLAARERGIFRALTDCGAAGLSSAVSEMGEDIGVSVDVANAPLKYQGLAPWEIWLSESQERIVGAVKPEKLAELIELAQQHEVEIAKLGIFEATNRLKVDYNGESVVDIDYDFLNSGPPTETLRSDWRQIDRPALSALTSDMDIVLLNVMAAGDVQSREQIVRQFDHEVQGGSVLKAYGGVHGDAPNGAIVTRPILDAKQGAVTAQSLMPRVNDVDPYKGAVMTFTDAVTRCVAAGGDYRTRTAMNENFVLGIPDNAQTVGALDMLVEGVVDSINGFEIPVISGKDSLSSTDKRKDGRRIDVPPVLAMSIMSEVEDAEQTFSSDIKKPGSTLVVVGRADYEAMGGSVYTNEILGYRSNVPRVDINIVRRNLDSVLAAQKTGKILSAHAVNNGGIAAAVSEMCFGGDCGVELMMPPIEEGRGRYPQEFMFNETTGRIIVEVEDANDVAELFAGADHQVIGRTRAAKGFKFRSTNQVHVLMSMEKIKAAWQQPGKDLYNV